MKSDILEHRDNGCAYREEQTKDHVRACDFVHEHTADCQPSKFLSILADYTRECLA